MLTIDTHAHWYPPEWVELLAKEGADRVVLGSDCPADMSYTRPVDVVERLTELSKQERDSILRGNAARLLKL